MAHCDAVEWGHPLHQGKGERLYIAPHDLPWALGPASPMGRLCARPQMKILLIGVGWNRCSVLHTAEIQAETRRTKVQRLLPGAQRTAWVEVPEVPCDLNRLFPRVGRDFEQTGAVTIGRLGEAECRLCGYAALVELATPCIDAANRESGERH